MLDYEEIGSFQQRKMIVSPTYHLGLRKELDDIVVNNHLFKENKSWLDTEGSMTYHHY